MKKGANSGIASLENQRIKFIEIYCEDNRDNGDLTSLVSSIKATGGKLLSPILLGPSRGSGRYEVIDGRRRFAALQALGRTELESDEYTIQNTLLDYEASAYIANTERKMLSPLEEAQQICNMLKTMTLEEIAESLGKSLAYVAARSRLSELAGRWQQVLAEPENFPNWTIGKLQLIAREPTAVQIELEHLIDEKKYYTHGELWKKISYYHRQLNNAPFRWQDRCRACQNRSDRQGVLFEEDAIAATCLDAECFDNYSLQAAVTALKENRKLKPVRSSGAYGTKAGEWADKHKVPASWEYDFTIVEDPAEADGIICAGDNIGRYVKIKHSRSVQTSASKIADSKAEREKKNQLRKQREILREAMTLFASFISSITKWGMLTLEIRPRVMAAMLHLGLPGASFFAFNFDDIKALPEGDFNDILLERFTRSIATHTTNNINNPQLDVDRKFEQEICKVFALDWQKGFFEPAALKLNYTVPKGAKK